MNVRIAPRLDIKGPNLVKGIHFEGLRVLGKPEDFAKYYYENGADELIYMDAVASLYGRNSLVEIVERTSREIFIPLTVGGGLRSSDDIRQVLRAGADKVSLNTAAIARPQLVREASRAFGSSTIVVSIEAMRNPDGRYEAYVNYGRDKTNIDALAWAVEAAELGAGEIMITSIDREGTGKGFDLELVREVSNRVSIPVIAGGGAGSVEDVRRVITEGRVEAVALASILHYNYLKQGQQRGKGDYRAEGNTEFLKRGAGFTRVKDASPRDVKAHLRAHGIACRYLEEARTYV
jgi:imidazole glycerol-phosphate synthase subunit HisF